MKSVSHCDLLVGFVKWCTAGVCLVAFAFFSSPSWISQAMAGRPGHLITILDPDESPEFVLPNDGGGPGDNGPACYDDQGNLIDCNICSGSNQP